MLEIRICIRNSQDGKLIFIYKVYLLDFIFVFH